VIIQRYWVLFWIAIGMAVHSFIVGRFLGSSFFMLLFFWGWVAAAAYRGRLESARAMTITMVVLLVVVAAAMAFLRTEYEQLAYYAFALYPAIVSWICVYFYIRHLMQKDGPVRHVAPRAAPKSLKLHDPIT
jgi:Ca2+/Na+ antiporter